MITDDPIRDLERQLVSAATTQAAPVVKRSPRRPRAMALVAVPIVAALSIVVALLLTGGAPTSSIAEAAYAQVSPKSGVLHLSYDTRFYDGHRLSQRVRIDSWYSADIEHTVATSLGPRSGRAVHYLETLSRRRGSRSYESASNTLTIQTVCRRAPDADRSTADPIALFRKLYDEGRVSPAGTTRFDGRRVERLVASERATQRLVYLVTPKTGEPVAMINESGFDRAVVRFTAHQRLPLNASTRTHLALAPHPGAKVQHAPGPGCAARSG